MTPSDRGGRLISSHADMWVYLFLILATGAVYWQVQSFNFVNFDDDQYISNNRHVQQGLTTESIAWAFTTSHAGNWHPVTWLSHILDCQLYGLDPGWHHVTSLLLHIANSFLVFLLFRRLWDHSPTAIRTRDNLWQCALVAALFALHPLHVESVAWVSERKDVLSTFFWLLTMWSYLRYIERPLAHRYAPVLLLFALGLMSKPMLVTLPFVLLLLDVHPLGRFRLQQGPVRVVLEKLPLFVLSVVSSAVTLHVQKAGGAVTSLQTIPLADRIANAAVSYVSYMGKMLYPTDLSVLYPYPIGLPWWQTSGACLLLTAISLAAVRMMGSRPWFLLGWLWFLGTLIPVIGIVQVGQQSMADRYTYIPLLGLFIILAWAISEIFAQWRHRKIWLATTAAIGLALLAVTTWRQVGYWHNSVALFEHALAISPRNYVAHNNLGNALVGLGRSTDAIVHYRKALQSSPDFDKAYNNLGLALSNQGQLKEAVEHYLQALRIRPDFEEAHSNLGSALVRLNRTAEAVEHYRQALQTKPDYAEAHYNLANALRKQDDPTAAVEHYFEALRMGLDRAEVHNNLANALRSLNRSIEAIEHYSQALILAPNLAEVHTNLAIALEDQGHTEDAIQHYLQALEINPAFSQARQYLDRALRSRRSHQ
jgi:tetratricopeptide (TPR) repeat protein